MRIWKENVTVLAISRMDKDKVGVAGINEHGQWIRPQALYLKDLEEEGEKQFKLFGKTQFHVYSIGSLNQQRPEDREIFWHEENKPVITGELTGVHRKSFVDRYTSESVNEVFYSGRTLGLVKPIIETVDFKCNPYLQDYEATFTFHDSTGEHFTFPCTEMYWRNYWLHWISENPGQLQHELMQMQWMLNEQDTYLVIGLTKPVEEWPGPYNGCWPLVLGVISLSVPDYIRDYNT